MNRGEGLPRQLLRRGKAGDALLLLAVPSLLVGIYSLPVDLKRSLAFDYTQPTAVTALTAHYVHLEAAHLTGNLISYAVLVAICYPLSVLASHRRLFRVVTVTYLLAFPFVLSGLNLSVPRAAVGYGFSGVNMAFAGFLPLALTLYARGNLSSAVRLRHAPGLFLAGVAAVPLLVLPPSRTTFGLAAATGLAVVGYAWTTFRDYRGVETDVSSVFVALCRRPGWSDLFVLGLVLFVAYPAVGYPGELVDDGVVVNVFAHFLGFCLAFIGPYSALELGLFEDSPASSPVTSDRGGDGSDAETTDGVRNVGGTERVENPESADCGDDERVPESEADPAYGDTF
jgi:hypothetical protein